MALSRARRRLISITVLVAIVLGGGGMLFKDSLRGLVDVMTGAEYSGSGSKNVVLTIHAGETGEDVARSLVAAGVTKSFSPTYREILRRNAEFFPGQYQMRTEMSSALAIELLLSGGSRVETKVLIKEGWRASQIFKALSKTYSVPVSEFEAVRPNDIGLPKSALNLDGYLFPATYAFVPGQSAESMLRAMHQRMLQELDDLGVKSSQAHRVLTLAALVQREGRSSSDFSKMARVFLNRIDIGMHLQSDATVSYGVNSTTVSTTAAQRANDNPWNTYLHAGLPAGPISAPGRAAIEAALNPANGEWLYFCTVNLETGETEFNETYAGHERSVAKWRAWMIANPGWE